MTSIHTESGGCTLSGRRRRPASLNSQTHSLLCAFAGFASHTAHVTENNASCHLNCHQRILNLPVLTWVASSESRDQSGFENIDI